MPRLFINRNTDATLKKVVLKKKSFRFFFVLSKMPRWKHYLKEFIKGRNRNTGGWGGQRAGALLQLPEISSLQWTGCQLNLWKPHCRIHKTIPRQNVRSSGPATLSTLRTRKWHVSWPTTWPRVSVSSLPRSWFWKLSSHARANGYFFCNFSVFIAE